MTEIKNIDELPLNSNSNGTYDFLNGSFRKEYQKKQWTIINMIELRNIMMKNML